VGGYGFGTRGWALPGLARAVQAADSMLGRLDAPSWQAVALEPQVDPPLIRRSPGQAVMRSKTMTSYALVNSIRALAGSYLFHAELSTDEEISGPGRGCGAGILGEEQNLMFFRSGGSNTIDMVIHCESDRILPVALVLGGYGKNAGAAGFRNVTLTPVSWKSPGR
jgi:hypothetical protein